MADRIKGITVEIGGDTTGLNKALSGTNKNIRDTQSQLKDVERLLKLDPTNTQLLRQKQRLLADRVSETKTKLDTLKTAEKQVQQQFRQGKVSQRQYDGLQREIVQTTESLKQLEKQASQSNATLSKINRTASGIAEKSGRIAGTMAPVTAAAVVAGTAAFNYASDTEESLNKVDVAFGESSEAVKRFADESLKTYGIARGTALDMAATYGDMGTSIGLTQERAADMATSITGLAGDLASFKNIGIDQAATALNGIFTGETESLKTLGIVMTQTNLDAYALANGFGKTTSQMTEAEKVQLRYRYIMNATRNAQGDFARTSDGAANSMRVAQEGVKELAAGFGEFLLPSVTGLIQNVIQVINYMNELDDGQKKAIITIIALVAAVSPVAGLISAVATAVSGLSAVMMFLTANPLVLIIAGLAAIVAAIVYLWNTSETFRNNVTGIWNGLVRVFRWGKDSIVAFLTVDLPAAFNLMSELAKAPFNGVIALMNGAINGLNMMIDGINGIRFDVPDWVPLLGGKNWSFNIPKIGNIPYLASGGTVINGMAIVGEAGPELLTVSPSGTKVIPLSGAEKARGAASININNITFNGYTQRQGRRLVRDLNRQLGRLYK